jgi:DNA-binding ferritin-like protein (Dps family)/preprotein translocase subunit SecG
MQENWKKSRLQWKELRKLRDDNEVRAANLQWHNQKAVERIVAYLKTFELPAWELQIVFKDLIGMAVEAEARDISFHEQLGDEEAFCKAVIGGVRKKSRLLSILFIPFYVSVLLLLYSIIGTPPAVRDGRYVRDDFIYLTDFLHFIALGVFIRGAGSILKRYTLFLVSWKKWILVLGYCIIGSVIVESIRHAPIVVPLFLLTPTVTAIAGAFCLLYFLLYYYDRYKRKKGMKERMQAQENEE